MVCDLGQAFGKALQLQWVRPGELAAQLLGGAPPGAGGGVKPRGRSADAPLAALHTALLDVVRFTLAVQLSASRSIVTDTRHRGGHVCVAGSLLHSGSADASGVRFCFRI